MKSKSAKRKHLLVANVPFDGRIVTVNHGTREMRVPTERCEIGDRIAISITSYRSRKPKKRKGVLSK